MIDTMFDMIAHSCAQLAKLELLSLQIQFIPLSKLSCIISPEEPEQCML